MKLRTLLEELSSVSGLTSEEKDPEEFLNSLLAQILKAEPFLKLNSGQEAFHYQLFVEKDEGIYNNNKINLVVINVFFRFSFTVSATTLRTKFFIFGYKIKRSTKLPDYPNAEIWEEF